MITRIQCPYCQQKLAGKAFLQRHIRTIHKSKLIGLTKE